jgi:hypothetical protein
VPSQTDIVLACRLDLMTTGDADIVAGGSLLQAGEPRSRKPDLPLVQKPVGPTEPIQRLTFVGS